MTIAQFVVIVAITLTTIAVALIVGAVFLMEKEQKQYKGEKRVAYLCDKKRACGVLGCRQCEHTTDITHAKNFKREYREYDGTFVEIEKSGEL